MTIKQQVYILNNDETGAIKVNSLKDLDNLHKAKKDRNGPYQAYAKAPNRPNNTKLKTHGRFNLTAAKQKAHGRFNLMETPIIPPPLTRKPTTAATVRKRSLVLSPLQEQLAEKVMEAIVPALSQLLQPSKMHKSGEHDPFEIEEAENEPFHSENELD